VYFPAGAFFRVSSRRVFFPCTLFVPSREKVIARKPVRHSRKNKLAPALARSPAKAQSLFFRKRKAGRDDRPDTLEKREEAVNEVWLNCR
jgi:hypothetical protein